MIYESYRDRTTVKLMKKYNIPITRISFKDVYDIVSALGCGFDNEEKFGKLVQYLKNRAKKDVYNRSKDDKEYADWEGANPDWLFYLHEYAYYINNILSDVNWIKERKKYLFPKDVYDITYKHINTRKLIFLEYISEHTDSLEQLEEYYDKQK